MPWGVPASTEGGEEPNTLLHQGATAAPLQPHRPPPHHPSSLPFALHRLQLGAAYFGIMVQARMFDKPTDIVQLAALGAYLHSTVTMCAIHNPYLKDICLLYHAYTKGRTQLPIHNAFVVAAADWAPPTSAKMWVLLWHLLPPRLQAGMTKEVPAWLAETAGQLLSSTPGTRPKLTLDAPILQDMAAPERVTMH
jgi:hypothetical protein